MSNIVFFSGDITRNGGTERVACYIANALAADNTVTVISLTEQSKEPFFQLSEQVNRLSLGEKWRSPGPGYISYLPKLRRLFRTLKPEVVIDIDIVLDVLTVPASAGLPIKVISWEHFHYAYEQEILYRRMIVKFFTGRADEIVTLTSGDCRDYQKALQRQERIHYIYNPVDRAADLSGEREKCILTIGGLIERKGMDYLAEVAVSVLKKHGDWRWFLLGEGEERPFLEQIIRDNKLEGRLILAGQTKEVAQYLKKASLYVCTSRKEGLPMSMLEAMGNGLPIVSFDIPTGPSVVISDEENGFLIEPFNCEKMAEAIERIMEDEALQCKMGRASLTLSEPFSGEEVLAKWRALLLDVMAR